MPPSSNLKIDLNIHGSHVFNYKGMIPYQFCSDRWNVNILKITNIPINSSYTEVAFGLQSMAAGEEEQQQQDLSSIRINININFNINLI